MTSAIFLHCSPFDDLTNKLGKSQKLLHLHLATQILFFHSFGPNSLN